MEDRCTSNKHALIKVFIIIVIIIYFFIIILLLLLLLILLLLLLLLLLYRDDILNVLLKSWRTSTCVFVFYDERLYSTVNIDLLIHSLVAVVSMSR